MLRKKKKRGGSKTFWNAEYKDGGHLALSDNQSEDLMKFIRFVERETGRKHLNVTASVLDLGCGNGRNLVWLAKEYGMRGVGYDISEQAITQARSASEGLPLTYEVRSIAGPIHLPDNSQTLILDMMASHFLNATERHGLVAEVDRLLRPGGFVFFKTFLLEGDRHAARLLAEHPGEEVGTYIHPEIGVPEHVFTQEEIKELFGRGFIIHKMLKSHRHIKDGKAWKRRSISVYIQKPEY